MKNVVKKYHKGTRKNSNQFPTHLTIPDFYLNLTKLISIQEDSDHLIQIERYYNAIIHSIADADRVLPRMGSFRKTTYWNAELSRLKNDSIVAFDFWKISGCPRDGPVF